MNKLFFLFFSLFNFCWAQLPDTDIWLFNLNKDKTGVKIEKGENITKRNGYDNQPSFSHDLKHIYYVSIREDKQADIFKYSIGSKKSIQLTKTVESEYSPFCFNGDKSINSVVVEKDSAQRIWIYDEVTGFPKKCLMNEDSVGYYELLNDDTVIYYKLTSPHSLRLHSLSSGKDVFIAYNPVRGFKKINRNEFVFGIKDSTKVVFYKYHTLIKKATVYCEYYSDAEDIIWHTNWGLLKSEQSRILRFNEADSKWEVLFDFSSFGIKKITRFVIDSKNKKLALVENK